MNPQETKNVSLPGPADDQKKKQNKTNYDSLRSGHSEIMNGLIYTERNCPTNEKTDHESYTSVSYEKEVQLPTKPKEKLGDKIP
ncbi:hypothetical protein JTB14_016764 [Gonioctena quinquepunctata]|nr:hypothetical protein JTB14_016764 [Gonioctena quinquepunctata]